MVILISPASNGIYWAGTGDQTVTPLCYHRNNQTSLARPEIKPSSQGQTLVPTLLSPPILLATRLVIDMLDVGRIVLD